MDLILSIANDLTSTVSFDAELLQTPDSGMYLNSGVHPSINVNNLLALLPNIDITFEAYDSGTTYGKYTDSLKRSDIVLEGGEIYQSKVKDNTGNDPATSPDQWLLTNIESLRVKTFALNSHKGAISKLGLNRRLLDSQYLYNVVDNIEYSPTLLSNNYAAWVFEAKGSDYTKFQINEIAFQATTATPQNLYVINQGVLVDTLTLNTNADGRLVFEDISYTFYGKGRWIFAVDSQEVLVNGSAIDPLKYDGFVAYMATGTGSSPETAKWSDNQVSNGLNFNIKAYLDSTTYLNYNLIDYCNYLQAAWQLDVLEMYVFNSNNRSNSTQRLRNFDRELIIGETKNGKMEGSALVKFNRALKEAKAQLSKTFDRGISPKKSSGKPKLRSV